MAIAARQAGVEPAVFDGGCSGAHAANTRPGFITSSTLKPAKRVATTGLAAVQMLDDLKRMAVAVTRHRLESRVSGEAGDEVLLVLGRFKSITVVSVATALRLVISAR